MMGEGIVVDGKMGDDVEIVYAVEEGVMRDVAV